VRILFVLLARFPSEKAYSVTTTNTIMALKKIGHNVEILSPNDSSAFRNGFWGELAFRWCSWALAFKSRFRFLNRWRFYLFLPVWLSVVKSKIRTRNYDLVWSRNLIIPIFLGKNYRTFTELHSLPKSLTQIILRLTGSNSHVLGPISPYLLRQVTGGILSDFESVLAPMAAPKHFFRSTEYENVGSIRKLCYIGRLTSLGVDQGVVHFIESMIEIIKLNEDITLLLIGVSENDFLANSQSKLADFPKNRIKFLPNVKHDEIPNYAYDVDAFVLPYCEKSEFRGRFPIKAIEYAAMGRPIIASDIPSHREVLSDNYVWFYSPCKPESLMSTVARIEMNSFEAKRKIVLAQEFANQFTYEARVQRIIKTLD